MLVVGGFKKRRVLDNCAVRLLQRCISLRQITAALLLITFISSMLVTNDVALITFVPLTLIIGKEAGVDVGKIIVWQTLAANLGSMLTPMGNPQNLFLYARYNFDIIAFFKVTWIPTCLAVALLAVFLMRQQDRQLKVSLTSVNVEWQIKRPVWLDTFLYEMGCRSTSMWFVHTYFCYYLFKDFIYGFKYPLLIFSVLLVVSYLFALVIDRIYQPLQQLITQKWR